MDIVQLDNVSLMSLGSNTKYFYKYQLYIIHILPFAGKQMKKLMRTVDFI